MKRRVIIPPVVLNAYLDGRLDSIEHAELIDIIEQQPHLIAQLGRYRRQEARMRRLYDPVLQEPVPERLFRIVRGVNGVKLGEKLSALDPEGSDDVRVVQMGKKQSSSIKGQKFYQKLREKGNSKEKATRIANANADQARDPLAKGGKHVLYEQWTREELYQRAQEFDIEGRASMSKRQLIDALRNR